MGKKTWGNEQGFTLLEVLASIVIVGIILLVFFGFYTQSMLFSSKYEQRLEALNIAREVHARIQQDAAYNTEYTRGNVTYYVDVTDISPSELHDIHNPSIPPFSMYVKEISVHSSSVKSDSTLLAKTFVYKKGGP